MIAQPRIHHWLLSLAMASVIHSALMVRFSADPSPSASAIEPGMDALTIALAPPPPPPAAPANEPEVSEAPEPEPQPLESPVKTPEPEPEPEPAPEPELEQKAEQPAEAPTSNTAHQNSSHLATDAVTSVDDQMQAGSTGGIGDAPPDYRDQVQAWLERHKDYPLEARRKGLQGMAMVTFTFDRDGHILDFRLNRETGHRLLDEAIEKMMVQASPLPAMPASDSHTRMTWTLPVYFQLN